MCLSATSDADVQPEQGNKILRNKNEYPGVHHNAHLVNSLCKLYLQAQTGPVLIFTDPSAPAG